MNVFEKVNNIAIYFYPLPVYMLAFKFVCDFELGILLASELNK